MLPARQVRKTTEQELAALQVRISCLQAEEARAQRAIETANKQAEEVWLQTCGASSVPAFLSPHM